MTNKHSLFLSGLIVLALTFGFTMIVSEISIGRKTKQSALTAYGVLHKKSKWIGVFACICLYRDAFFDFAKKNQKLYIFEMMAFSVIQVIGGVGMLHGQPIWGEEGLSIVSIVFATALCFFAVGVTAAIKTYTDARQED